MGSLTTYLRRGSRTFLTYSTTGRGNERVNSQMALLDQTVHGRGEAWEQNPEGWPEGAHACWTWRSDAAGEFTWGETSRPTVQWGRPGATAVKTLGRTGSH
jgi:predicted dithiol-disulfide oxidoreductase (DUF899 family)